MRAKGMEESKAVAAPLVKVMFENGPTICQFLLTSQMYSAAALVSVDNDDVFVMLPGISLPLRIPGGEARLVIEFSRNGVDDANWPWP